MLARIWMCHWSLQNSQAPCHLGKGICSIERWRVLGAESLGERTLEPEVGDRLRQHPCLYILLTPRSEVRICWCWFGWPRSWSLFWQSRERSTPWRQNWPAREQAAQPQMRNSPVECKKEKLAHRHSWRNRFIRHLSQLEVLWSCVWMSYSIWWDITFTQLRAL